MYINEIEIQAVGNYQQFMEQYNKIVDDCRQVRDAGGFSQSFMAEWCGVGRWRIIEFEQKKHLDMEMLFAYAEKLSIEIIFHHQIS
jgi:DNA-binding XRE family transcriptional regulator